MKQIMGIQVGNREEDAIKLQEILTKNGCIIKTRIGLHESSKEFCATTGLIILEFLSDNDDDIKLMEKELEELTSLVVKKMVF